MDLTDEYLKNGVGFITRCAEQYGDAVPLPFHVADRLFWIVSDPTTILDILVHKAAQFRKGYSYRRAKAALGEGLFTSDGEVHRRHRRLAAPFFHHNEITRYGELMIELANQTVWGWKDGQKIDVCSEMSRFTLTVVARALFGAELYASAPHLAETLAELLSVLHERTRPIEVGQPRVSAEEARRFAELRASFDETVFAMIAARRASGTRGDDLLGKLLGASEDGQSGFDDYELRDELVTLIISGHDTTGVTVSFALWLLAKHPEIREQVEAEVERVVGDDALTVDLVPRLVLLGQVLDETLRLYPPVWMLAREALTEVELPTLTVRKGDSAGISLFRLHRDPRWWADPDVFRPERFAPGAVPPRPGTYLPFGAGGRTCIGRSFAEIEGILMLAAVTRRARLEIDTSTEHRLLPYMLLRPAGGIPAHVHLR